MSNEEKKSCIDCAYIKQSYSVSGNNDGVVFSNSLAPLKIEYWFCRAIKLGIPKKELRTKFCDKFLLKKKDMTLEQQLKELEEQKQEEIKKQQLAEQARITKENNRLPNRLKRNWKAIVGIIGVVASIATIVELYLLLIRY